MYTAEQLCVHPFFRTALRSTRLELLLDSLTGVVSRPWMLRFVRELIEQGTPFALAILDLDNFKHVNDNYGHHTGDLVLSRIGSLLADFAGEEAVVGRYGGDEFLLVHLRCTEYQDLHSFFRRMYHGAVFRRNLDIPGLERPIHVTATVGSARYPADADSFDGLFALSDKALYRGKSKGRNCFILYVADKHAKLQIRTLTQLSLYDTFRTMVQRFDEGGTFLNKLNGAFSPMRNSLHFDRLLWQDADGLLTDVVTREKLPPIQPSPLPDDVCAPEDMEALRALSPALYEALEPLGLEAVLLARAGRGCLVFCPEPHTKRVWQDGELAAAFFLSRLVLGNRPEGRS